MANESVFKYGTGQELQATGSSALAAGDYVACATKTITPTESLDYPDGKLRIAVTFATGITKGNKIHVYARALNIDGTNDERSPSANFSSSRVGSFIPDVITSIQYLTIDVYDLPEEFEVWLENGTDQSMSSGWTVDYVPVTIGPV